jgi:hypothetical protein
MRHFNQPQQCARHLRGWATFVLVAAAFSTGCGEDSQEPQLTLSPPPTEQVTASVDATSEFPTKQRINLGINARGPFRPGTPIQIVVTAVGNLGARNANLEVMLLDQEEEFRSQNGSRTTPRKLGRWSGDLTRGAQRQLSASVTFDRPGYYRVYAQVKSTGEPEEQRAGRGDTLVFNVSHTTLWILIDENGGRLTEGFDSLAAYGNGRQPKFGPFGPFVSMSSPAPSSGASANTVMSADRVYGYIKHHDLDSNTTIGLAAVLVRLTCYDNVQEMETLYDTSTDANGYFDVACSYGEIMQRLSWTLFNSVAQIKTPSGALSAGATYLDGGAPLYYEGHMPSNYAAHVFKQLNEKVPIAVQRFGRNINQTEVRVSDTNIQYGIHYSPTNDRIETNFSRIPGEDGWFVTLHEFGHRYQYIAIDRWAASLCDDENGDGIPEHGFTEPETLPCAFVEGFADFFSMWIAGDRLGTAPYSGDWGLENNSAFGAPTNNPFEFDGLRVEASVAAFLYDLVDGEYEPDGPNGFPGNAEAWDNVTYPASWLANVMHYCRVDSNTKLGGADQLIYCLERDTTARTESLRWSIEWRTFSGVTFEQFVATYDKAMIRRLWKYNLYGVFE